jgi:uncharacterized damage-inducible protein DinB
MKRFVSNALLDDLMADTRQILLYANKLEYIDRETLQTQPAAGRWSVAQVLEHLNFYSRYYLKAIEQTLHRHQSTAKESFTPGWFGDYFTKMMKPTPDNKIKSKMKALKSATPLPQTDATAALAQFISDQHTLLNLLQIAKSADIGRLRVPTSITNLIKLKLGDTFRFFIAHEQRHVLQMTNTLQALSRTSGQLETHS